MIDKQTEGNEHQLPTSCIKHWGLSGNLKLFCPASAFATADTYSGLSPFSDSGDTRSLVVRF